MVADWVIMLAIALAVNVASYVLMPKPKAPKPGAVEQADDPTAEAGKPMPVLFGTVEMRENNILWFGDKTTRTYEVKA